MVTVVVIVVKLVMDIRTVEDVSVFLLKFLWNLRLSGIINAALSWMEACLVH